MVCWVRLAEINIMQYCRIVFILLIFLLVKGQQDDHHISLLFANRKDVRMALVDVKNGRLNEQFPIQTNFEEVTTVDFYYEDSIIFWSDIGSEMIRGIKLNNKSSAPIVTYNKAVNIITNGIMSPDGLAVDWLTKKLYWTDSETNRIEVSSFEGKNRRVLHWMDMDQPRGICLVPMRGLMFWTDWGEVAKIESSSMDGDTSTRKVIIDKDIIWPNGLTADYDSSGRIFWADAKLLRLESADFDGDHRTVIVSEDLHHPFAVTIVRDCLFWSDWTDKSIHVVNKTSGQFRKELISSSHGLSPLDLHVYSRERQPFMPTPCHTNNGGCSNLCLLTTKLPGFTCSCPTGIKLLADGKTCAPKPESLLLLARRSDLRMVSLDTPDHSDITLNLNKVKHSIAVDYDVQEERVYWTDDEVHVIRSAFLDGSGSADVVNNEPNLSAEGIAIDWVSRNIYWTDTGNDVIEVARLNGSSRRTVIADGLHEPRAIAVHPILGYIYWSDWGTSVIERSALDGSLRETIINSTLKWPNGLTIDYQFGHIYWSDAYDDKIEMSTLTGSDRRILVKDNIPHVFGLSILDEWLYWTDWQKRSVERVDKVTGGNRSSVIEQMPDLMGLKSTTTDPRKMTVLGDNLCATGNGGCQHLCFYLPDFRRVCGCPNGFKVASDMVSCEVDPSYVKVTSTKRPPSKETGSRKKNPKDREPGPCFKNGGCSHVCVASQDSPSGRICSCPSGMHLSGDDRTCIVPPTCNPDQFQCKSGRVNCVQESYLCDGSSDCDDGSDEVNCPTCQVHDYKCPNSRVCLSAKKFCDGHKDCPDGSDEECCQPETDFTCSPLNNRKDCVHLKFVCDGNKDCLNGADEDKVTCPNGMTRPDVNGNHVAFGSVQPSPDVSVTSVQTTFSTFFWVISLCILVVIAIVFLSIFGLKRHPVMIPDTQDINQMHPLTGGPIGHGPRGSILGINRYVGPSTMSKEFRVGQVAPAIQFNGNGVYYDGTGCISSSSSSNNYPRETFPPPPSPETTDSHHYETSSRTSSNGTSGTRKRLLPSRSSRHPPTPVALDADEMSAFYGVTGPGAIGAPPPSTYSYTNSQVSYSDYDLYQHPSTPYEVSSPPSPGSSLYRQIRGSSVAYTTFPSLPPPPPSPEPT